MKQLQILVLLCLLLVTISISGVNGLSGERSWSTPNFADGSRLDYVWGYKCFGEDKAGDRIGYDSIIFKGRDIIDFSVFLTGYNKWYTREGNDHEVMQDRIDVWPNWPNHITDYKDPDGAIKYGEIANIKFEFALADEDTGDSDDYYDACIAVCVVARTKPL
jgi:hypothetical protein